MQTAKTAAATAKESALNVAASAQSGLDKTKAVVQEKGERLTAKHPMEKEVATERKQEKIIEAEMHKQQVRAQNAAAKESVGGMGTTTAASGVHAQGHSTGLHKMSCLPGHGTGETHGRVTEGGVMGSHPKTGTGGNPLVGGGGTTNQGYGTGGGGYS